MTVYWQSVLYLAICSGEVGRIQNVTCGLEIYLAELFFSSTNTYLFSNKKRIFAGDVVQEHARNS